MTASVPVTIVCGFLGAGKSTLVNRLLREPGDERLGVLVNDFGAINIDKDLIKVRSDDQIELTNGCVCCTIRDDLASGLVALGRSQPPFTRVVLECSGVSHPAGVLGVFDLSAVSDRFHVDGVFCLIDCDSFVALDFQGTELAIDQAAYADLVLLNKTDLADGDTVSGIARTLLGAQPYMRLVRAEHANTTLDVLFGPRLGTAERPTPSLDAKHDHAELYRSLAYVWDRPLALADVERMAAELPASIVRAKGILHLADLSAGRGRRAVFHLVGKRSSLTLEDDPPPATSRLVVIGRKAVIDDAAVARALACCPGAREVRPDQPAHVHPHD
jgi:G3E family GTPase